MDVRLWGIVLVLAGCGRIAFDQRAVADGPGDDGPPAVECWSAWESGSPAIGPATPIAELAMPDKQGNPWFADARTLIFDTGTGDTELFRTTRAGPGAPFATPVHFAELSSPNEESGLTFTADGEVGVISSTRAGSAGFDLYETTRADANATFGPPDRAAYAMLNTGANQFDAFLVADGLRVYYSQSASGGQVLRTATRATRNDAFGAPIPVPGAGTFNVEADPEISADGRVMVFSAGSPLQLFFAVRSDPAAAFGTPTAMLPGPSHDADPTLTPDGCELVWISDRGGDRDLYHATIEP